MNLIYGVGHDGINAYPNDNQKKNSENYQGYGVGYDGINAYENTSKNNQGYGFANYPNQQYQSNNQNNQNNSPILSPPLIEKAEDEPNDYNFEPNKPKIGPVIEVPSFGVPYPGEDNNEKGYEFSSGIFVHNNNDTGYSSGYGGYGFSQ